MNLLQSQINFFIKLGDKDIKTKWIWIYYICCVSVFFLPAKDLTKKIAEILTNYGLNIGQAFYFSGPILIVILVFLLIILGVFITGIFIYVISLALKCNKSFKKSFQLFLVINMVAIVQIPIISIYYLIYGYFVQLIIIRYIITIIISILLYLGFCYTLECTRKKAFIGTLIFIIIYSLQNLVKYLPNFLN